MIQPYRGQYSFSGVVVEGWDSTEIGVYYCGHQNEDSVFCVTYVGRAVSKGGIRGRLLQHLSENKWPDVTHFGYKACSTAEEAIDHEATEIVRLNPAHNAQGK